MLQNKFLFEGANADIHTLWPFLYIYKEKRLQLSPKIILNWEERFQLWSITILTKNQATTIECAFT